MKLFKERVKYMSCRREKILEVKGLTKRYGTYTAVNELSLEVLQGVYILLTASIYSIGMLIASISGNIKTANLLTSLVYFPMFFLSGATIPYEIMPRGLKIFAGLMPLTHGIKLLKGVSLNLSGEQYVLPVLILCITALAGSIVSVRTFRWE